MIAMVKVTKPNQWKHWALVFVFKIKQFILSWDSVSVYSDGPPLLANSAWDGVLGVASPSAIKKEMIKLF